MKKSIKRVLDTLIAALISQFNAAAPPETMRVKLERTGDVEKMCDQQIKRAHKEKSGKLTVGKKGVIHDENGHTVRAFAFGLGRFVVEGTLYIALMVDLLEGEVHLLLVRSNITDSLHALFPDLGIAKDWQVLQKCVDRFSPKYSIRRHTVDVRKVRRAAAEAAATRCVEQCGAFQQRDLSILRDMPATKLHLVDLCSIIALFHAFLSHIVPRMIHVVVTGNEEDVIEVRRVFKSMDLSIDERAAGLDIPSILVKGPKKLDIWRRASRFSIIRYEDAQDIKCLFDAVSQTQALNDTQFLKQFPYPPVVLGPHIWTARDCTEIDVRGLRFSDEELLTGRRYIASLLRNHLQLTENLSRCWAESVATQDAALTPYPDLWFRSFHFAAGTTLFPASNALMDYLEMAKDADVARLRLRDDRQQRYDNAIADLKSATAESPWVSPSKPSTKAEALALLEKEYDAFLHHKDGQPVFAFTEESLIRHARLERHEIEDFVLKLKENHLLTSKTHPISFKNQQQRRFICINAEALTVTDEHRNGGGN